MLLLQFRMEAMFYNYKQNNSFYYYYNEIKLVILKLTKIALFLHQLHLVN